MIHLRIDETEDKCLISHESLIVRLRVADRFLVRSPVRQFIPEIPQLPVLVRNLFYEPYPVIGDPHSQAVVETETALLAPDGQSGHTAYVFGYGNGVRTQIVYNFIGQSQIDKSVFVDGVVIIIFVRRERPSQTVMAVEHAGNTIETKPVESVLVKPETTIGKQEMDNRNLTVIETPRIPCLVTPPRAVMKILVRRSVEATQALDLVIHRMGMDQVHNDPQTGGVRGIHQFLELLRSSKPGRSGEKIRNMVSEGCVIGMFRYPHQLNGIIPARNNPRENLQFKLQVGTDLFFFLGHTDVCFIYERRCRG